MHLKLMKKLFSKIQIYEAIDSGMIAARNRRHQLEHVMSDATGQYAQLSVKLDTDRKVHGSHVVKPMELGHERHFQSALLVNKHPKLIHPSRFKMFLEKIYQLVNISVATTPINSFLMEKHTKRVEIRKTLNVCVEFQKVKNGAKNVTGIIKRMFLLTLKIFPAHRLDQNKTNRLFSI